MPSFIQTLSPSVTSLSAYPKKATAIFISTGYSIISTVTETNLYRRFHIISLGNNECGETAMKLNEAVSK